MCLLSICHTKLQMMTSFFDKATTRETFWTAYSQPDSAAIQISTRTAVLVVETRTIRSLQHKLVDLCTVQLRFLHVRNVFEASNKAVCCRRSVDRVCTLLDTLQSARGVWDFRKNRQGIYFRTCFQGLSKWDGHPKGLLRWLSAVTSEHNEDFTYLYDWLQHLRPA